jgi:hypothetical protein
MDMQNLALLMLGWALGLLSAVFASLLIRYFKLRKPPDPEQAQADTGFDICRVLLLVGTPIAVAAVICGFVLLLLSATPVQGPVAGQVDGTRTAEAFQQREGTAQAEATARRSTEQAAARATEANVDAGLTAIAVLTQLAREPTPTPEPPTSTPEPPTSTPQPPTETPTATDSPTPRPTRRPTATPRPTKTPEPKVPWKGDVRGAAPNCDYTQLEGLALDSGGALEGNVWIHYWTDGWEGAWALSSPSSSQSGLGTNVEKNWDAFITDRPRSGTWYACVVADTGSWDCISNQLDVTTSASPCEPGSRGVQLVYIIFQRK